jgi:hypothetical protein
MTLDHDPRFHEIHWLPLLRNSGFQIWDFRSHCWATEGTKNVTSGPTVEQQWVPNMGLPVPLFSNSGFQIWGFRSHCRATVGTKNVTSGPTVAQQWVQKMGLPVPLLRKTRLEGRHGRAHKVFFAHATEWHTLNNGFFCLRLRFLNSLKYQFGERTSYQFPSALWYRNIFPYVVFVTHKGTLNYGTNRIRAL